ncbi:RNA polymerase sigma factor (sigma-70 family) [Mucilaginibacter sp. UYP25]|uniref:RNA polymerase sigma factor n=1 Tax=unclassified Mucilaginibacter TaxID=2617802 RepID=UPI00339A19F6
MHTDQTLHQHQRYLYAYAFSRTGNQELARDLVQETYLAALENRKPFEQRCSLRTWLTSILKHKTYDAYRKMEMDKFKLGILPEEPSAEMFSSNYELLSVINKVLSKLPPVWQLVFTMKDLEDRPAEEICRTLNLSPANYWVISHRTRRSLKESLRDFV